MTIDANIVIAYLGGDGPVIKVLSEWKKEGRPLFLPTVVETEILSFSRWTGEEQKYTEQFLEENFISVSFSRLVSRIAAEIRRENKIKFPDAIIAASALFTKTPVVTRNIRDFKRISGLQIVSL
ncbi:MAG: type II toxin-antitoxin system VapC family toxin [Nanoarchaeota archaeon]|nr:type II toxin-antitoxin system VapC family toxin [Nanoarchaeota archaeon]